ncbi:MAG: hypothetical protein ACI9WC_000238 [Arenicella sp.]|jgi:hypothetical protein
MRLPDDDGKLARIGISASVDKLRYFLADTITLQLVVSGTEENESISASANIKLLGGADLLPVNLSLTQSGGNRTIYQTIINTNSLNLNSASQ